MLELREMPGATTKRVSFTKCAGMQFSERPVYKSTQSGPSTSTIRWLFYQDGSWYIGASLGETRTRKGARAKVEDDAESPEQIFGRWMVLDGQAEYQPVPAMHVGIPPLLSWDGPE
jgi:hypothetical protein